MLGGDRRHLARRQRHGGRAALSGIYRTALYRFAANGEVPGDFAGTDFQAVFEPRREIGGSGGFGGGIGGFNKN